MHKACFFGFFGRPSFLPHVRDVASSWKGKAGAGEAELQGAVGSSSASEAGKRCLGAVRLGYTRATDSKASTTRMRWHWATVASGAQSTTHVRRIVTTAWPELSFERWQPVAELSKV